MKHKQSNIHSLLLTLIFIFLIKINYCQNSKDINLYDNEGNKTGLWKRYFDNGKISQEVLFSKNVKCKQNFYDKSGKIYYSFIINPDTIPNGSIIIDGGIYDQLNPENEIEFILIKIKDLTNNKEFTKINTLKNKYVIVLPIGSNYEIEFVALGYLPMKIKLNTFDIKDKKKKISCPAENFFLNTELIKSITFDLFKNRENYLDTAFLVALLYDKPVLEINYPENANDFNLEIGSRKEFENFKLLNPEEKKELSKIALKRIENKSKEVVNELINLKRNQVTLENDLLRRKNLLTLKENETRIQQITITIIIGILILLFVFSLILFKRFKLTDKQKKIIVLQKQLVDEKNKEISESINYAERIQKSFFASEATLDSNLKEYFIYFKPRDTVSGDFYWAIKLSNGNFAFLTADSTGHGVPGAIMSLLNITSIEEAIKEGCIEPYEILNHARKSIINRLKKDGSVEGGKDGMDASLISFDFNNNKLYYSCANNPIWIVRHGELIELKGDKMPVGKHDKDQISFSQNDFNLIKNDLIYTLTDGFPDQFGGEKGKKFMYKQLKDVLVSISNEPIKNQKIILDKILMKWMHGYDQVDDITLIGIKI
jgi:serine phosphatase RsbU (regulator of sigma subunit)